MAAAVLAPCSVLPGELLDKIVDTVAVAEDLDTLRSCLMVCAAFRLRAWYNLLARLDLSPDYGREHAVRTLELLDLLKSTPALAPMPQSIALDWNDCTRGLWADVTSRVTGTLPQLPRLASVTFSNMDSTAARKWVEADLPALSATSLTLECCELTASNLEAVLRSFPALTSLDLVECYVELADDESYVPTELPFTGCSLALSDEPTAIEWARLHPAAFALSGFAASPCPASLDFVAAHAEDLRSLTVCVNESTRKADEEIASAAVAKCNSLEKFGVIAPSIPRALLLFRSVAAVAPSCRSVEMQLEGFYPPSASELHDVRKCFRSELWCNIYSVAVNGELIDLTVVPEPEDVPLPPSPIVAPIDIDDEMPALLDRDDLESIADSDITTPALSAASTDNEMSDAEEEFLLPAPRVNPFAPPFALGVSAVRSAEAEDVSEPVDDLPTPTPHQSSFLPSSDEEEEGASSGLPLSTTPPFKLNPLALPFVLGSSSTLL